MDLSVEELLKQVAERKQFLIDAYNNPEHKEEIDKFLYIYAILPTLNQEDEGYVQKFDEYRERKSKLEALGVPIDAITNRFVSDPHGFDFTYNEHTLYDDAMFEKRLKLRKSEQ